MYVFEVIDRRGKRIRLTQERWNHIVAEDHRIHDPYLIEETLVRPTKITLSDRDTTVHWFYTYTKQLKRYLLVSVKYLNGEGFVITAFYTSKIQ